MQRNIRVTLRIVAGLCLLAAGGPRVFAQTEGELTARKRLLSDLGPGLRAVRRSADGRTYVLASPSPGLLVFDTQGKQVLSIGAPPAAGKTARAAITFGEDCDVSVDRQIYVADRGANAIQIFSPDGALL